jgi:hypothetical protein
MDAPLVLVIMARMPPSSMVCISLEVGNQHKNTVGDGCPPSDIARGSETARKDSNSPPPQMPGGAAARLNGNGKDRPEAIGCMLMGNPEQRWKSGRVRLEGSLQTRGSHCPNCGGDPASRDRHRLPPGSSMFLLTHDTYNVILIISLLLSLCHRGAGRRLSGPPCCAGPREVLADVR